MSDQFVGEIRPFACNFAPVGFALCNGQLLPISQNTALFSLIGTYYGGNGTSNFALPNLQGQVPIGQGQGPGLSSYVMGQSSGSENVSLLTSEIPPHTHTLGVDTQSGTSSSPSGAYLAQVGGSRIKPASPSYASAVTGAMAPASVTPVGGSQPHNNMMPYLVINYCIALSGTFPARS